MRRAFCDKEFQKRKEWRTCVTTDPQTQNATASVVNDRSYATACHSMLARSCWLGDSTRICDAQAAPPRICDAQAAPPTNSAFHGRACLATAASFPFPGHPTNPGSAEENHVMKFPCRVQTISRISGFYQPLIHSNPYSFCKNAY